ncbi:MAG: potassium channel family protein [Actinomycetes bacterium]
MVPALIGITLLLLLYYSLPLDRAFDASTIVLLVLGLVGFCALLAVQVMQIMRSPHPRVRAMTALMTSVPLFLVLMASGYYLMAHAERGAFNEHLSRTDALYFTVTVFSTVGFGDIVPKLVEARVLVMLQMIGDLIVIGVIGRVVVGAVSAGLQRNAAGAQTPEIPNQAAAPVGSRDGPE